MVDLLRDYRICAYHPEDHGGVHLHHPLETKETRPVDIRSPSEAEAIMTAYAETMTWFDPRRFEEVMRRWRSGSKKR